MRIRTVMKFEAWILVSKSRPLNDFELLGLFRGAYVPLIRQVHLTTIRNELIKCHISASPLIWQISRVRIHLGSHAATCVNLHNSQLDPHELCL